MGLPVSHDMQEIVSVLVPPHDVKHIVDVDVPHVTHDMEGKR